MEFQISTSSDIPIYRQLAAQIRRGVVSGRLAVGEQLPSVRELSRQLVVNPNTIARAYLELERDGVVHSRQGIGVFVALPRSDIHKAVRRKMVAEKIEELCVEAIYLGFTQNEIEALLVERAGQFNWKNHS